MGGFEPSPIFFQDTQCCAATLLHAIRSNTSILNGVYRPLRSENHVSEGHSRIYRTHVVPRCKAIGLWYAQKESRVQAEIDRSEHYQNNILRTDVKNL